MIHSQRARERAIAKAIALIPASTKEDVEQTILKACDRGEFWVNVSINDCSPALLAHWLQSLGYETSVEYGVLGVKWS